MLYFLTPTYLGKYKLSELKEIGNFFNPNTLLYSVLKQKTKKSFQPHISRALM